MRITEDQHQEFLFQWAQLASAKYPELSEMYHIPNGGSRTKSEGARFKRMGVKAGMPDVCLPVPRGQYASLYVELKAEGGTVQESQKKRMAALTKLGNLAVVCYGWESAKQVIENYLRN